MESVFETLKVLVCDDEPGMRLGIARALRDFSFHLPDLNGEIRFTVDLAESGEQAVEKIDVDPPHLLLLDHKLPGISGLDVLDHVAAKKSEVTTIMITAYASIDTAVRATRQGAYDFLPKPFTPAELRNAVRKAGEHIIMAQQARRLAKEKHQVRFQFISVLAHELKAPLGAIEGYLELVRDHTAGDDPATYQQIIERCLTRTTYMRKMILDLLDMTRIESGQKKRELALVDLREVAQSAIETVLPDANERQIVIHLQADAPVTLMADRSDMEVILNNLISNAVKYNRPQGRVDVTMQTEGDHCLVSVADTGIGMSPEECAKLFSDFVRIKNNKTRDILGSGLGLSIIKKLAQTYGGNVSVSSTPDVGSTFSVTLHSMEIPPET